MAQVLAPPPVPSKQRPSSKERVRKWVLANYGALSEVARDHQVSVSYVQRVAYNIGVQSKGLRIERALLGRGCPLMQQLQPIQR